MWKAKKLWGQFFKIFASLYNLKILNMKYVLIKKICWFKILRHYIASMYRITNFKTKELLYSVL